MAKKEVSSPVEEVSQVENGSVVTNETEVTTNAEVSVSEEKTEEVAEKTEKVEEKSKKTTKRKSKKAIEAPSEEISESEKADKEIAEDAEEAEKEVATIDEKVAIEEAVSDEAEKDEVDRPNEKYFAFDKREARRIFVDRERFLGVIFYKRLIVGIRRDHVANIDSIVDFGAIVADSVEALVHSLRFEDVNYTKYDIDETKNRDGGDVGIIGIDIPFTAKTNIFVSKIKNYVQNYPECFVRASSICRVNIDTLQTGNPSIIKGFTSFASFTQGQNSVLRVNARSASFLQKSLGFEEKDVNDLNRYILSNNKLNTVGDDGVIHTFRNGQTKTERYLDYYQVFRNKLCGMIYEITDIKDSKYLVSRLQFYIRLRTKKTFETIVPIGIKIVTKEMDPVWISDLRDIFTWNDVENKSGFLGNDDLIGTDPNIENLMDDINQIQVNILDPIEDVGIKEEETDKVEEKTEEKK